MVKEYSQVLPIDLLDALRGGQRSIETAVGTFILASFPDVRVVTVVIPPRSEILPGTGAYCTVGICPILSWPAALGMYGVVAWFPLLGCYGYYDEDDTQGLVLFPFGLLWPEIEGNLPYYCSPDVRASGVFRDVWDEVPVKLFFDYIPTQLQRTADLITSLDGEEKEKAAEQFVLKYERPLTAYPLSPDLAEAYPALITVYKVLAEICTQRTDVPKNVSTREVISLYERCALLVGRFKEADLALASAYAHVLLRLTFWYSDIGDFEQAESCAQLWTEYDPSARAAYPELRGLLKLKRELGAKYFQGKIEDFEAS
ncbi:hypothetical protein [Parachryseolinea silvisoli]|uniref:hypothetical protein n=1 Tax=Parachryseolinea silvisoli TaxID=2873601 RepID=UPI002265F8D8|nr:hypothetical protein [Parachryseolinea silvisoli]MCD9015245.1 hypothetical protein [Parachryseolinea silvisoli]